MAAYSINSLKKLSKDDMQGRILGMQEKYENSINQIPQIANDIANLKNQIYELKGELATCKAENIMLNRKIVANERRAFASQQYSRRESLEVSGLSDSVEDGELEGTVLKVFKKIGVTIDPTLVQACHRLNTRSSPKKVIIKLCSRKDVEKVLLNKNKLKDMNLSDLGVGNGDNSLYINESLCGHYRLLWTKCKMLWKKKEIKGFKVASGKVKVTLNDGHTMSITHIEDLINKCPGNEDLLNWNSEV